MIINQANPSDSRKWILKANDLNDRAKQEIKEIVQLFEDIRYESSGPQVAALLSLATAVSIHAERISCHIAGVTEAISSVSGKVSNTVDDVAYDISGIRHVFD